MANLTGIIILAAGNSSRLGTPKQLLEYKGKSLLQHAIDEALLIQEAPVIVVIGATHQDIENSIKQKKGIAFAHNKNWNSGMGSSIKTGLQHLLKTSPGITACIITVCDQPFINSTIFNALINAHHETGTGIVASAYAGTIGTPALFDKDYFNELINLNNAEGAKKLLQKYDDDLIAIPFENGEVDIDTIDDYERLKRLM